MDFFIIIGLISIGFLIGWHLRAFTIMKNMVDKPDEMIKLLTQLKDLSAQEDRFGEPVTEDLIELETEIHRDTMYAYDRLTGQFIAQGSNEQELLESAKKRFPGKKFWRNDAK
jgi:hypothetical protein